MIFAQSACATSVSRSWGKFPYGSNVPNTCVRLKGCIGLDKQIMRKDKDIEG